MKSGILGSDPKVIVQFRQESVCYVLSVQLFSVQCLKSAFLFLIGLHFGRQHELAATAHVRHDFLFELGHLFAQQRSRA